MDPSLSRRSMLGGLSAGALAGAAGCLGLRDDSPGSSVEMDHGRYYPRTLTVDPGTTVSWRNADVLRHTVTAYEERIPDEAAFFDSGGFDSERAALEDGGSPKRVLDPGDRFRHTFEVPGYYHYFCVPHEQFDTMAGTVVVREPGGDPPPRPTPPELGTDHVVGMGPWSYAPDSLTIRPGDSVGWVNDTGIAHSVTAAGDSLPDGADYFASGGFDTEDEAEWDWYGPREGDVLLEEPFVHTFETPGEYSYYCFLHATNMVGTITVTPARGSRTPAFRRRSDARTR